MSRWARTMLPAAPAVLAVLLRCGTAVGADLPCGLHPADWCPAPQGDACGTHANEKACRADSGCRGLPYRGESVVACEPDGKGFWTNCPAVGCVARADPPGRPPRPAVVEELCSSRTAGGEDREIHVWRSAKNETTVLELRTSGASGPLLTSYFDAAGRSLLSLPGKGAPGHLTELRARVLAGLRDAATVGCGTRSQRGQRQNPSGGYRQ